MIWLPYKIPGHSAEVLNYNHLCETYEQGLVALREIVRGHHLGKQAEMWRTAPGWLLAYVGQVNLELGARFNEDPDSGYHLAVRHFLRIGWSLAATPPDWLLYRSKDFLISQRSQLIWADPEYYAHQFPLNTPLDVPIIWPKGT